jgi:hypothetical protein
MMRVRSPLMALAAAALAGLPAYVNAQSPSSRHEAAGFAARTTVSAEGTITAVNLNTRTVTVALSDGRTVQGQVLPAVGGLDLVKIGDKITARYEETVTFTLAPAGSPTPADRVDAAMATSKGDELPAGIAASESSVTWIVVAADLSASTISLINPAGGEVHTFDVTTPEGRSRLGLVKRGDKLTITFANYVFGVVTRKQ